MTDLSERIKSLRLSANMTQEEFGKEFGIVKSTVSLYENGKSTPNDELKKQICNHFHVSLDYLLGNDIAINGSHDITDKKGFFFFFFDNETLLRNTFAKRIKIAIADMGLTEAEFKDKISFSEEKATAFLEETADPTADDLIVLSQFLDTSIDYLLDQVPKVSNSEKKLLNAFVKLNTDNQDIIIGKTKELLKEQEVDSATLEPPKNTGTDSPK